MNHCQITSKPLMENLAQSVISKPTTTATTMSSKNEDVCISPNNRYDDILTNINKSNKRLSHKLSQMPPLPKYMPILHEAPTTSTTTTKNIENYCDFDKDHCALKCMPNCYKDLGVFGETAPTTATTTKCHNTSQRHIEHNDDQTRPKISCWRTSPAKEFQVEKKQHCCLRSKHCPRSMYGQNKLNNNQTDPLPCLQPHLALNPTIITSSSDEQQQPSQSIELTGTADNSLLDDPTGVKLQKNRNLSPHCYFQELLKRDTKLRVTETIKCKNHMEFLDCKCKCKKHLRPPVKVDINVRLVPKSTSKTRNDNTQNKKEAQEEKEDVDDDDDGDEVIPVDIAQHTINELEDMPPNIEHRRSTHIDELDMQSTQL